MKVVGETTVESSGNAESASGENAEIGFSVGAAASALTGGLKVNLSAKESVGAKKTVKGQEICRVNFGSVATALQAVVERLPNKRLWILFDEWSEVPLDLQPYLADLLRRAVLPARGLVVKIAAIEQRSHFLIPDSAGHVGLELGADVAAAVNLDDYMVFDNDEQEAVRFFQRLVFAHVTRALVDDGKKPPATEAELMSAGFTQVNAFNEIVRACEGVPRDALNILFHAAQKAGEETISMDHVRRAAQQYYQASKDSAVSARPEAKQLLVWIIEKVIKERQTKAFLLEVGTRDALIDFLYDERVLHVLRKGISAKDSPGVRYNVYGIDYGCYVDLINTARAPKGVLDLGEGSVDYSVIVPKTDLRSIRRCILDLREFYFSAS